MRDHRDNENWFHDTNPPGPGFDPFARGRGGRRGDRGHRGRRHEHHGFPGMPPMPPGMPAPPAPPMAPFPPAPPGVPGWGFGPPHGGRGRRRMRRGDVRAAVLSLLVEEPRNGYQLIQELGSRSGGMWRPSPGSVYPALQQMEDEGLIRAIDVEGKRTFELTDDGRSYAEEHADRLRDPWQVLQSSVDDEAVEFQKLVGQVVTAAQQVTAAGGPGQVTKARALLAETRRGLYRILAEDEEEPTAGENTDDGEV